MCQPSRAEHRNDNRLAVVACVELSDNAQLIPGSQGTGLERQVNSGMQGTILDGGGAAMQWLAGCC